ncbi:MAG: DoxX family protein [Bacteroidota bacterium]|nr:DoxX family protein [Bacteroidota bacterium]
MIKLYFKIRTILNNAQDLPLLFLRLILAYGFWEPAKMKWADINGIAEWFDSMGIVAPKLSAYLAASTEMAGVFLLIFGLGTRIISIPLIITMLVAIKTVHWENGFASSDNGYEIPLYYMLMLITLLCFGPGKISADYFIGKKMRNFLS